MRRLPGPSRSDVEQGEEPPLVEREDGSWLVSGAASADLLTDRLGVNLPGDRDYSTVAGFALSVLKHLPETGEKFRHDGWSFEIVDMDGRKIDKLIASRSRARSRPRRQAEAGRLKLPEPLFEAVGVVAGEIIGLLDDPVARDAAARNAPSCASSRSIFGRVSCASCSKRLKPSAMQRVGELRPDALDPAQVVVRLAFAVERAVDRRAEDLAGDVARRRGASPASPRPSGGRFCCAMCGRTGALSVSCHALPAAAAG